MDLSSPPTRRATVELVIRCNSGRQHDEAWLLTTVEAEYLVVGAGATGMAFTDALIENADVRVAQSQHPTIAKRTSVALLVDL